MELIRDVDGLRRERRNTRQRRVKKPIVCLFIKKTVNNAYAPKIVLGAQKIVMIKNHFPSSLHSIKISKLSGLFNDDKSYGGEIKQKR